MKSKPLSYEPRIGTTIYNAVTAAILVAKTNGAPVSFAFNDTPVTVTSRSNVNAVVKRWHEDRERDQAAYAVSPAGRAAKVEADERRAVMQCSTDSGVNALRMAGNDVAVLSALRVIAENADHIEVKLDRTAVIAELEQRGYKRGEAVGLPKAAYQDRDTFARYIVGQVLECLYMGMPPHPVTIGFIDDWMKRADSTTTAT